MIVVKTFCKNMKKLCNHQSFSLFFAKSTSRCFQGTGARGPVQVNGDRYVALGAMSLSPVTCLPLPPGMSII